MTEGRDPEALRGQVRAWLRDNAPVGWREAMAGAAQEAFVAAQRDWFFKLAGAGYATPHWPEAGRAGGARWRNRKSSTKRSPGRTRRG